MEPNKNCENLTLVKNLSTSHLTSPFSSFLSVPIQTCNPHEKEGDRDIEAITQSTFFELIRDSEPSPFPLALVKDSSGAFAVYDAFALRDWVVKKPINPISQAEILHTSLYKINGLLGECEFLGSSTHVKILKAESKSWMVKHESENVGVDEGQDKELDTSHMTRPFASRIKFPIQRYNPATKKQEMVIEALTKRSFLELIKARESLSLSFVLALVEDSQGEFSAYDASEFNAPLSQIPAISPLKKEIKRISWYKIDRLADDFTFLGDSISAQARFIDCFIRANTGDLQAQYALGCMYAEGTQVAKDSNHAMHFFRLVAKAGHVQAFLRILPELVKEQKIAEIVEFFKTVKIEKVREIAVPYVDLFYTEVIPLQHIRYHLLVAIRRDKNTYKVTYLRGKCHKEGIGVNKSLKQALAFFEEASGSCSKACYEMGVHALESRDLARAKDYLIRAGKAHVPAQLQLAKLYLTLEQRDFKAAIKILNRLCEQKIQEAFVPLAELYIRGGDEYPANYERAYELLKTASEFDVTACYLLARELINQTDRKFSAKAETGFKFIEKAIKMAPNDGRLYWLRFCCYRDGVGVQKSEVDSVGALMQGANLKDESCAESLGYAFYYERFGLKKDLDQAIHFLTVATNETDAQLLLAKIYSESRDSAEQRKAVQLYEGLSNKFNPLAHYQLYLIYQDGLLGEIRDPNKAATYLNLLKMDDPISYCLEVGLVRLGHPVVLSESISPLDHLNEIIRLYACYYPEINAEMEELIKNISKLAPKKDEKAEYLIYLVSAFALIPLLYLKRARSKLDQEQDGLAMILFNKFKTRIEHELDSSEEPVGAEFVYQQSHESDYSEHFTGDWKTELVRQINQLFYGIYNLKNINVDLKSVPRKMNSLASLYKMYTDREYHETDFLWKNCFE